MITLVLLFGYLCGFSFVLGLIPVEWEMRPTLQSMGLGPLSTPKKKNPFAFLKAIAKINKPICQGQLRKRIIKDLAVAHINISPEEFLLYKELCIGGLLLLIFPTVSPDTFIMWTFFCKYLHL